jgi:hypothetical protein
MDEPLAQIVVGDLAGKIAALVHQHLSGLPAYSRMAAGDEKPAGVEADFIAATGE